MKFNLSFIKDQHVKNKYIKQLLKDPSLIILILALLLSLLTSALFKTQEQATTVKTVHLKENLDIFLPQNHVIFPFVAENYEPIESLLGARSFVRVIDPSNGKALAENIKVFRAPKDPSQLAFVIPIKIANQLAQKGSIFRLVIQKPTKKPPQMTNTTLLNKKTLITFGS